MGLFRWKFARCLAMASMEKRPLGTRSRAGSPGRMRNSTKLNDAMRTIVSSAFRILRVK